jgi:hypothetical protein
VAPADDLGDFNGALVCACTTAIIPNARFPYSVAKRAAGTGSTYNPRNGSNGQWTDVSNDLANARYLSTNEFAGRADNNTTVASTTAPWYIHVAVDAEL